MSSDAQCCIPITLHSNTGLDVNESSDDEDDDMLAELKGDLPEELDSEPEDGQPELSDKQKRYKERTAPPQQVI